MSDFTHHLRLWLDNEEWIYNEMRLQVRRAMESPFESIIDIDLDRRILWQAEQNIKDTVEEAVYGVLDTLPQSLESGIVREFTTMGLANVEWREIAESYLEVEQEPQA